MNSNPEDKFNSLPVTTKAIRCRFYSTPSGCKNGKRCAYKHEFAVCRYSTEAVCRQVFASKIIEKQQQKQPLLAESINAPSTVVRAYHCTYAHWQKCRNFICSASTLRTYCKFCWRSRQNELQKSQSNSDPHHANTNTDTPRLSPETRTPVSSGSLRPIISSNARRVLRRCITPKCQLLTTYLYCVNCFYATSAEHTRIARAAAIQQYKEWPNEVIKHLREKGLMQEAENLTKTLESGFESHYLSFELPLSTIFQAEIKQAMNSQLQEQPHGSVLVPEKKETVTSA